MKIDLDQVRELLGVVSQTDVTELSIESGNEKITIKKPAQNHVIHLPMPGPTPEGAATMATPVAYAPVLTPPAHKTPEPKAEAKNENNGWLAITSPMVGTFYKSPSPTAQPFVEVGDTISVGQTVCIIEAMKLMNDLPAEVAGRIVKICVDNGTTVEYGQTLFMVDPNG